MRLTLLWQSSSGRVGLVGCFFMTMLVIGAPFLTSYGPDEMLWDRILESPSWAHPLGTDDFGRDMLTRTLYGARLTLTTAVLGTVLGVATGTLIGLFAGYVGGLADELVMRIGDAWMSVPSLVLAMLVLLGVGEGTIGVVVSIGIVFAPRVARVVRSAVLDIKMQEYVSAAKVRGESVLYIVLHELLPNLWTPIVVEASVRMSYAVLLITSLGYLGLGVQPPTADWGLIIGSARSYLTSAPWILVGPALGIVLSVLFVNLLADGVQEVRDVRRGAASHLT